MKTFLKNSKFPLAVVLSFSFLFLLSTFYFLLSTPVIAQSAPEFMITWQSNNYAPSNFRGKILPIDGSRIDMALELISGGKIANLSNNEIQWLINGNELKHGLGMKNISFAAEGFKGDQKVIVTIKGYGGQDLTKIITVPLVSPEVVITGGPTIFEALPYFFNIQILSLLKFRWTANGIPAAGLASDPSKLTLDTSKLPAGAEVVVSLNVHNTANPIEIATQKISFQK